MLSAIHNTLYLGVNVFQELIQNAEDAHATQVKFLHDKHSHGESKLHSKELSWFQVLSILVIVLSCSWSYGTLCLC